MIPDAVVYDNHPQDSRITPMGNISNTVNKQYGTGGGNVPLVQEVAQVQWASGGGQVENDTAQALRSNAEHNYQFARTGMQVRRLTPVECCRLQSFPDAWNESGIDENGKEVKMSDSHRYKQLGNAVTVNVAEWLANVIKGLL
jgi:site-specific DNA-cytosine methylase